MKILLVGDSNNSETISFSRYLIGRGDEVEIVSFIKSKKEILKAIQGIDVIHFMNVFPVAKKIIKVAHEKGTPITIAFDSDISTHKSFFKKVCQDVDAISYQSQQSRKQHEKLIKKRTNGYVISYEDERYMHLVRQMISDYCGREISETGKYRYYRDKLNDDFANTLIETQEVEETFKIIHNNVFFRFFSFILYYVFGKPLIWVINKIVYRQKIINKKVLKDCKDKGYFLYGNHTSTIGDAFTPNILTSKRNYIIASHDTFSIKGVRTIVLMLGAIPVFKSGEGYKRYVEAMEYRINQKRSVTIYSEAHIWPYYTEIRPYSGGSFRYPYDMDVPVYCLTNTWIKTKHRKKPKLVTYVDGPFYPNKLLERSAGIEKLREDIYHQMKFRAESVPQYQYIKYIKIPNHEE